MNKWSTLHLIAIACLILGCVEGNHIALLSILFDVDAMLFETAVRLGLIILSFSLWLIGLYYGSEVKEITYTDYSEVELND